MARFFYSLLLLLLAPLLLGYLYVLRGNKNPGYRRYFSQRLGFGLSHLPQQGLVIHCASVGEVLAATPLIKALKQDNQAIIISCNTPTGRAEINKAFANDVDIQVCYLPIDFAFAMRRFLTRLQPKAVIVMETELWPNLFHYAKQQNSHIMVVNARLSHKSFQGYKRFSGLSRQLMDNIDLLAAHDQSDGERFIALGLAKTKLAITGSVKFDISLADDDVKRAQQLRQQLQPRPVWLAGSTHPGEHEQVIAAHQALQKHHPDALLIIAPRHPEQFSAVAELLEEQGLSFTRRSQQEINAATEVLLADTLGELKWLFGCADVAFIGGSLIPRGGHNPLEAAAHSKAIISGPHTYNFAHIYPQLIAQHGALIVANEQQLGEQLMTLLSSPEQSAELGNNAAQVLQKNTGAIAKTVQLIQGNLE